MSQEAERGARYRAHIIDAFASGLPVVGAVTIETAVPPFAGDAIVDLDVQSPALLGVDDLARWAAANDVTIRAIASWGVALPRPDENHHLRRTHARESGMQQLRSWTGVVPALAEIRRLVEERIAPWLPFGATRRALVHLRRGADEAATTETLADVESRRQALSRWITGETIERWVPHAHALAAALAGAAEDDFRAWAFLAKLGHAAVKHGHLIDIAPLVPQEVRAGYGDVLVELVLDRVVFDAAFSWAGDPALGALMTYRGVRLDDFAIDMLVRRHGNPGFA